MYACGSWSDTRGAVRGEGSGHLHLHVALVLIYIKHGTLVLSKFGYKPSRKVHYEDGETARVAAPCSSCRRQSTNSTRTCDRRHASGLISQT
jgi:hypothetical protein